MFYLVPIGRHRDTSQKRPAHDTFILLKEQLVGEGFYPIIVGDRPALPL